MTPYCDNRLTVVGPPAEVKAFDNSKWRTAAQAKYVEVLQLSPRRHCWVFETEEGPPLEWLLRTSRRIPKLTFLLDYELSKRRRKGVVKASNGRLDHMSFIY